MRKGTRRVIASAMAALMTFSLLSAGIPGGVTEVKAAELDPVAAADSETTGESVGTEEFVNGLEATSAEAGKSYYYDFTEMTDIPNTYSAGLFSFNAGSYNAAAYKDTTYGIEFKSDNKLTFQVAGNSYIVVGGDNNNNCTDLKATSGTGIFVTDSQSTVTAGHATLDDCKTKGSNTIVYEYQGTAGSVTLEVDSEYTKAEGQSSTKAYIAYVCVIPMKEGESSETPSDPGTEEPVAGDGFVNGLVATSAEAGKSYYYDFTEMTSIPNTHSAGLFSFDAGSYNAAAYKDTTYGIEFKSDNKLTFQVAGNSYIVVGGDNNNNCTDLKATSGTGIFVTDSQSTVTAGHATLDDCKTKGSNTIVYEYQGTAGSVTLEVDSEYTKAEGQSSTKAYIAYVCVIPMKEGEGSETPGEEKCISAGTYALGGKTADEVAAIEGLSLGSTFAFGNGHGIQTKAADTTLKLNLKEKANVEVTTCCYGAGAAGTMTASAGTVTSAVVEEESQNAPVFTVTGVSGELTLTFATNMYIHSIKVEYITTPDKPVLDPSKADVWDFGAETVEGANNNLTVAVINGFYPENVTAGSAGNDISTFSAKDGNGIEAVKFVSNKTNNRIRTTNTAITRRDEKSLAGDDGHTYTGYVYSNSSSTADTRLEIYLYEGDTLTCMLGSNGNAATYIMRDPSGANYDTFAYTAESKAETAVFHAASEGWYQLYCSDEKLVCARITRKHAPELTVSGSVTAPADIPAGYALIFTNETTGKETVAEVAGGAYSCSLYGGYTYKVSLKDANGFVISENASLVLGDADATLDPVIQAVAMKSISGNITGLSAEALAKVKFEFKVPADKVYVPEIEIDRTAGTYTLKVETGVEYTVEAQDVNDFALDTVKMSAQDNKTEDIAFTKKPVYPVTLTITGVEDASGAVATFTNINEEGYVYTFPVSGAMELRDGSYSVKVTGLGNYAVAQGITPNVNVSGEAASTTVPFEGLTAWDFKAQAAAVDVETIDGKNYYAGLVLSAGVKEHNNSYLLAKAGDTITVPNLQSGDKVTIKYCYEASFKAGDMTVDEKSGSTGQIDSVDVLVAQDGDFVIETVTGTKASQTYFCGIEILKASNVIEYRDTLYVGTDKEYKTINDALTDVRKMARTAGQTVTIMIDPGNYEEMLVIDTPDITLKNASAAPSIELKNKGVDIDDNAVRVTWYYGHGYTYYSMGSDCKYDADLLAANKSNGSASFKNPGSGTTNGSYWNASVVVSADRFSADGIIFENSFNQYVSAKSVEDTIEAQGSSAKEGSVARANMKTVGDTKVQEKEYVERAAALAITNNVSQVFFNNCKFVSRQDTLYGGTGVTAGFENCAIYGGTDYIFGGMTAVFKHCDLVFNTNDQTSKGEKDDVGYITAAQQSSGRGYLLYECTVTSTVPGVDTASVRTSKPGYLGRPWQANTGEAVFYKTTIEAADGFWNTGSYAMGESLIRPAGWLDSLGGKSALSAEYGTIEKSGVDNSAERADWAKVFDTPNLADGSPITIETFLGSWNPFSPDEEQDDLVVVPEEGSPIAGVTTEGEVVFTDEAGEEVTGEVVIKAEEQEPTEEIKAAVALEIAQDAETEVTVLYLDIAAYLVTDGQETEVSLTSGKVWIRLAYPEGITRENDIVVLHGTEKLAADSVVKEADSYRIAAEGFSPYTVIFKAAKTAVEDPADPTGPTDPTDPTGPVGPADPDVKDEGEDDDEDVAPANPAVLTSPKTYDESLLNALLPSNAQVAEDGQQVNPGADAVVLAVLPQSSGISIYPFVIVAVVVAAGIIAGSGIIAFRRREEE
ncbi:MAG: pectinesterase family protein [Clostridium sp.]|nr:pectinesterase family protein [Bacteroides sp.]MCM1564152.1 pectinesterase family protein [Clostridium sp.]